MKIRSVTHNSRRKAFEIELGGRRLGLPYAKATPRPTARDRVVRAFVDEELGREGFGYVLDSGEVGTVHVERVLEYHRDPAYMRDLLLYKLTQEARKRVSASPLARREIVRRLGTSAAHFHRLLDPTNDRMSIDQLLALLQVLDCEVDLLVRRRSA